MDALWKKEIEFQNFIKDIASNMKYPSVALYADIVLIESYFEFVTRILLGQFELTEEEEDNRKQAAAIDQLAGEKYRII
ncbi:MAG: hypothetical protein DRG50_05400, partial [Deltaproteobacteria bacterium]